MPLEPDTVFADRSAAGEALAAEVVQVLGDRDACDRESSDGSGRVVLALPRGGVPVAAPVAATAGAPLDVLVVRKLGVPGQPELAMGAIAEIDGRLEVIRNQRVLEAAPVSPADFETVLAAEARVLAERTAMLRPKAPVPVENRTVVLVDDGLATGSTMRAAVAAVQRRSPARVVVAVPVGAASTCAQLGQTVDLVICLVRPKAFRAVGQAYADFTQTTDREVRELLSPR